MSLRRTLPLLVVTVLCGILPVARVLAEGPRGVRLDPGDAHFFPRATVDSCGSSRCSYDLLLGGGGHRLRVAVRHSGTTPGFSLTLFDPDGRQVASAQHEAFVTGPEAGLWRIEVSQRDEAADAFFLRAKLEREPVLPNPTRPLKPNLRAEPGYDFGFSYAEPNCQLVTGACGETPVPLPPSCAADETAEDHAVRCLRFSFGYQNAGRGPLDLRFGPMDPSTRTSPIRQRIFVSDETPLDYGDNPYAEVDAGSATYHEIHGHFHYNDIFGARLFRVVDEDAGELAPVGEVAKRGACAHDIVFVGFRRFYQDPQHLADSGTDCNFTFTNPTSPAIRIGLSTGWADIYPSALSDNYVDFGLNADGLYLLRFKADVDGTIEETNERDNVAYSLIGVEGLSVELLERGRGTSPWDPHKVVLHGLGG